MALAAIETIDRSLDPLVDAGIWQPVLDGEVSDVVKAYVVRILEATGRTARRRGFLPRCEVRVHLDALKSDFLSLVFLHRLCAIRDVHLHPAGTGAAGEQASPNRASFEIADAEVGSFELSGDGIQTLVCTSRQERAGRRSNLGSALRQSLPELLAGMSERPRPDLSGSPPGMSVVIPVYDRTDRLLATLASVLNQDYPWCELILVFNGSPESTLRLVPKIRQQIRTRRYRGRVLVLPHPYGAANIPRNIGSFLATGELILFLDSDDLLGSRDFLTRLAQIARDAPQHDLFYPRTVEFVNIDRDHPIRGRLVASRPDVVTWRILYEHGNVLNNSGVCVRATAFVDVAGLNPSMEYCEDYELFLRILGAGGRGLPIESTVQINLHSHNNEIRFENQRNFWHNKARESAEAFHSRSLDSLAPGPPDMRYEP